MMTYPKRLIEVDLPIKRISAHARREKSIRHGHISTLHIWWARRPLAACRAVLCASLWPDPADPLCPQDFRDTATKLINAFAVKATTNQTLYAGCDADSQARWVALAKEELDSRNTKHHHFLRNALLDFIADFANWDNSTVKEYLETARALTQSAHEALGGQSGTLPLVADPFAGGGSIPLEALRVGADAFASDLNPVAVLLNMVMLEFVPKYGQKLVDEVRRWGEWIKIQSDNELANFYPKGPDNSTTVAYIWSRTIMCEGPGCGAEIPLMRSPWLNKRGSGTGFLFRTEGKRIELDITEDVRNHPLAEGTIRRSSVTCPRCGFTVPADSVRTQFNGRGGGARDARMIAIVCDHPDRGRIYRSPTKSEIDAVKAASIELGKRVANHKSDLSLVPDEPLPYLRSIFNIHLLDVNQWGQLFTDRQALALTTIIKWTHAAQNKIDSELDDKEYASAITTCLALAVDRGADYWSSLAVWAGDFVAHTFGRQALGIIWDFCEANPFSEGTGNYQGAVDWVTRCLERDASALPRCATVQKASATEHPLPNDSVAALFTDPPYYDAVPYADLSDFFYVWLKRSVGHLHPQLFSETLSPKSGEIVQLAERNKLYSYKTSEYFEEEMTKALDEGRRILSADGVGVIVFAHKTTLGWETLLQSVIKAGWTITASWPVDTERPGRLRANNAAALASSIHLVCRPREFADGSVRLNDVGDWRDILQELPKRIHDWMPRLAGEGVVGADAIFACLGPALEIFSRCSRVEKASGEQVTLREYLEHVWGAVAEEALKMIFEGADAKGFEEDARLTAMWLWTLSTDNGVADGKSEVDDDDVEEKLKKLAGFTLEYDAARKIAQGLGAHLENLSTLIEVRGDKAVLLPVSARTRHLFGKDENRAPTRKPKKDPQLNLLASLQEVQEESGSWGEKSAPPAGSTVLDRIHQAMILFAANRNEAIKRFLVEDGVGKDHRFWKLAQSLSALYPKDSDEKRWVDGVLGRKKSLGF